LTIFGELLTISKWQIERAWGKGHGAEGKQKAVCSRQYAGENQTKRAEGMGHREDTSGIID